MVVGEAPGAQEDKTGPGLRGPGREAPGPLLASVGLSRETGLYLQRPEVPAAGEPKSPPRGNPGVHSLPPAPDRSDLSRGDPGGGYLFGPILYRKSPYPWGGSAERCIVTRECRSW